MNAPTPRIVPVRSFDILESPIGELLVVGSDDGLQSIAFAGTWRARDIDADWQRGGPAVADAKRQLREYFDGTRRCFELQLSPRGSPFQHRVWDELVRIEYGTTTSYGDIARRVGLPDSARAVGAANGANPIPIVVPCHRVIGSDGSLTGFGGGIQTKRWLLRHEGAVAQGSLWP